MAERARRVKFIVSVEVEAEGGGIVPPAEAVIVLREAAAEVAWKCGLRAAVVLPALVAGLK